MTRSTPRYPPAAASGGISPPLNHNVPQIEMVAVSSLKENPDEARIYRPLDEKKAAGMFRKRGPDVPLLASLDNIVWIGGIVLRAARLLGLEAVPVIRIENLTKAECQQLSVAYSRLGELGTIDSGKLAELHLKFEAEIPNYETMDIGYEVGEIDFILTNTMVLEETQEEDETPVDCLSSTIPITKEGDVWLLGKHRVACGDSTNPQALELLIGTSHAAFMFTDPPFGCAINGFVASEGRHREFVMGSGDMSPDQLLAFFTAFISAALPYLIKGAVVELVIDWRSLHLLLRAAEPLLGPLLNLAVWVKDRPAQGSFLRSQHELILIFKVGKGRYRNNVQGGRNGRNRSNVWRYPSAKTASTGSDEGDMLKHHPTPKSVRMVADAILDCTKRGDIVLDAFLGSGTTLIAAEKVGRICYGLELDPLYVDLIVRRWQAWSGEQAVHENSGKTFDQLESDTGVEETANG